MFDTEGRMSVLNGLVDGVYYENGKILTYKGLIKVDDDFYYISDYAKPVCNKIYYITKTNDLTWDDGTPVVKGYYMFDTEGKMSVLNGLVDGVYYENGKILTYKGLIKVDGVSPSKKNLRLVSWYCARTPPIISLYHGSRFS